jgi:hypothetical protein
VKGISITDHNSPFNSAFIHKHIEFCVESFMGIIVCHCSALDSLRLKLNAPNTIF